MSGGMNEADVFADKNAVVISYRQERCPVHGMTTFGPYYDLKLKLADGCLNCAFEQFDRLHKPAGIASTDE